MQMVEFQSTLRAVDHLVYAAPNLDAGVDRIEHLLGVRATLGGRHLAWGTRNALLSLGEKVYLEIIAPDPEPITSGRPRPFGIDTQPSTRLATWAVKGTQLEQIVETIGKLGLDLGEVSTGSRLKNDGIQLYWKLTDPYMPRMDGIVPFFIDWGTSTHPAVSLPKVCSLIALNLRHPQADRVGQILANLGIDLPVETGVLPAIIAEIQTPGGVVHLS